MKRSHLAFSIARSASALALGFLSLTAQAVPFTLTSTLTGDLRVGSPDNLIVKVTIKGDDETSTADWVIDINSPLHPNVKLDEFYFNMVGAVTSYTFTNFVPTGWDINSTDVIEQGLGGVQFNFEAYDPPGQPNADDITNSQNLSFTMNYAGGFLTQALFTGAATTCANEINGWCGQLGAHLQSLTKGTGDTTDSGFAMGKYEGGSGQTDLPEPGVLFLMGAGLLGLGMARRRKAA